MTTTRFSRNRRVRRVFDALGCRRAVAAVAAVLVGSAGPLLAQAPAHAAVAGTSLAPMCTATNPAVHDPTLVGDARRVTDILVLGDTVYVAGKFTALVSPNSGTPVPRNHIGACSLTTGEVLPWTADADDVVFSLATDGTSIYAGGSFNAIGGQSRAHLAALDPQSGAVLPWAPSAAGGEVRALAISGGTLYAGGTFKSMNGQARNALAALQTSDATLGAWDPGKDYPSTELFEVRAIVAWQSKIVIGEWLDNSMDNLFAVDNHTGRALPWKTTPSQSQPVLGLSASGNRVYAAVGGSGGHIESFDPATGARKWDVRVDGNVQGIWAGPDIVYAGGHFEFLKDGSLAPPPRIRAIAITADDTGTVLSWNPGVDHVGNGLYAVEGGAGSLLLGGEFTTIANRPQQGIGRFGADFIRPVISGVAPSTLSPGAPQSVTVSGSGFAGSPTLSLGPGVDLSNVTVVSPSQLTATATVQMSAPPGSHTAMVTSSGITGTCGSCTTVSGSSGPGAGGNGGDTGGSGNGGGGIASPGGYRLVARDGGIFAFGDATFKGSTGGIKLVQPIVSMTSTPSGQGYWLTAADGGIFAFGDARFFGSTGAIKLAMPIVAMTATPSGQGYWMVASDGGIFAFGDAAFKGSTGGTRLTQPIVGMTATPSGQGYWLVAADGGIFAFGDAAFKGSTGSIKLARPIIGMTATKSGQGYWMVASDGGIFAFGDAAFKGSTGSIKLAKPIVGIAATASGNGYWMVASDGGIFAFGDAAFKGSTGSIPLAQPIVGMARS